MTENKGEKDWLADWKGWSLVIWAIVLLVVLYLRWQQIHYFVLTDTDDNLRMVQVRDWIAGQGWYDLRQHRLLPPAGADIHWSRLVDIPLAAIIVLLSPFFGQAAAEAAAIALAPVLPLALVFIAMGAVARRTLTAKAWIMAIIITIAAPAVMRMFMPTRIDHHGWQLAALAILLAGLVDQRQVRGGLIVGAATALSLAIGLEILPYLAIAGAIVTLRWIVDAQEAPRLSAYALTLAAGTALAFFLFASNDNWQPRCDAISTVWVTMMGASGLMLFALAQIRVAKPLVRLGAAAASALILLAIMATGFPHCLSRPEGISDEAYTLWFQYIREVKPLYEQGIGGALATIALPVAGLIGAAIGLRTMPGRWVDNPWLPIIIMNLVSTGLLLWQTRVGPVAQLVAIPGAAALSWKLLPLLRKSTSPLVRTLGVVIAFLAISGLWAGAVDLFTSKAKANSNQQKIGIAFAQCTAVTNWTAINKIPQATLFTFVDLAPRLIAMTHHRSITGPYHRNDEAIVDVHKAFVGSPDQARQIINKYKADYVFICPNMAEATLHKARGKDGFYAQLQVGATIGWLEPVPLPKNSPFKLWRVKK